MVINVYDNQKGYCQLLQDTAPEGMEFECIDMKSPPPHLKGSLLIFFLSDEIEFMDFVKLYSHEADYVICGNGILNSGINNLPKIKYVDINLPKEELMATLLGIANDYKLKTPV
ncbi:hypothetical protein [Flavobacterium sp.]|uniref:hypothetical protein n=1 Tax=Flavobacterium sp. TaxID=239 RepID=UPI002626E7FC|nr:hypothetical protein [Flavobacterium sp.]